MRAFDGIVQDGLRINTHQVIQRGCKVALLVWSFRRIGGGIVRCSVDRPLFHTSACQHQRVNPGPVVTPGILIDLRRTAEFRVDDNQCVAKTTAFVQIVHQRAQHGVEFRAERCFHLFEVAAVCVPRTARRVTVAHVDHWHTRFSEPPGQQTTLSKFTATVAIACRHRFRGQIECLPRLG